MQVVFTVILIKRIGITVQCESGTADPVTHTSDACAKITVVFFVLSDRIVAQYPVYPGDYEFKPGKGAVLREGKDAVIVASGIMVHEAMEAAKMLAGEGIDAAVMDPVTVKPLDEALVREYAEKAGCVVTAENHNKIGGLTSAVQNAICGMAVKFGCVAVEDVFGEVGPQDYLRKQFDLTAEHIVREVKRALDR